MALTGTTDFIVHVAVRDMHHLRDLVWSLIERREVGARAELARVRARRRARLARLTPELVAAVAAMYQWRAGHAISPARWRSSISRPSSGPRP